MTLLEQKGLEQKDFFLAQFDQPHIDSDQPAVLRELRQQGMAAFHRVGLPTNRDEEWRFTSISPIAGSKFARPSRNSNVRPEVIDNWVFQTLASTLIVVVDGYYRPELSRLDQLPDGVVVGSLRELVNRRASDGFLPHLGRHVKLSTNGFTALNAALFEDAIVLYIPEDAIVPGPIQLLFVSGASDGDTASHLRTLIVAGARSRCTVLETYAGSSDRRYLSNAVTEIAVGDEAVVEHCKFVFESLSAFHIGTMQVQLGRQSTFASHAITLGGALVRNDATALLAGQRADCTLNGLYLADRDRLIDNHTTIDHAMPNCTSHEVYKGILNDRARGVFNGKIFVRLDAQKTDAKQTNKTLLLSDDAQINTKPQLEIFADDVKCTHGATVGQLDAEALFYLRSRGIGEQDARSLLIHAFAGDIINRIELEPVRERLEQEFFAQLDSWLMA